MATETEAETTDPMEQFKLEIADIGPSDPEEVNKAEKRLRKAEVVAARLYSVFGAKLIRIYEIMGVELAEEHLPQDTEVRVDLDEGRVLVLRIEDQ